MKKILFAICVALAAVSANASMTYSPFLLDGYDASGNPISSGTYVMVLDLDGDGWNGLDYLSQASGSANNASSWLWDADDYIMDIGAFYDGEAFPFSTFNAADVPGFTANVDQYYVLWFDVAYNPLAAGPGIGINYGAENLGTVGTDPGNYGPFLTGGNATLQTIPEPATALLALIGGGMAYVLRRNKRQAIYIG